LFMGASFFDRLRLRLPDPEPSPVGLANAGFPPKRGRRFFLGLGEEVGGPIYRSGSQHEVGPQRRAASPKPPIPIGNQFLMAMMKIQAQGPRYGPAALPHVFRSCSKQETPSQKRTGKAATLESEHCATFCMGRTKSKSGLPQRARNLPPCRIIPLGFKPSARRAASRITSEGTDLEFDLLGF
jgi:hypothetical protein